MLTELIYIRVMQKKVSFNLSYPFLVKKTKTLSNRNRSGKSDRFSQASKSLRMVTAAMKLKDTYSFKKALTNLDSILKTRDITLQTEVHMVKAMVFPVVVYGCES